MQLTELLHVCNQSLNNQQDSLQIYVSLVQAEEEQQGLQASDLKAKVLKGVVDAKRRAQPDINTSIYRHNKAKGPNPMAFKKKKKKMVQQPAVTQDAGSLEPKPKKARKRQKLSQPVEDDSNRQSSV